MEQDIKKQRAIMFFGPQGAGKGTQKALVKSLLEETTGSDVMIYEPGNFFRGMMKQEGYTNSVMKSIQNSGALQPDFLPVYAAVKEFVENYSGQEHIMIDGFPRKKLQAELFHQMTKFYDLVIEVVLISLSKEESVKRLTLRGRSDDTEEGIAERLRLYGSETEPLVEFFKKYPDVYKIHEVNGDQTVEEVFADITKVLELK